MGLLALGLPVVGEGEIEVERERARLVGEPTECRLGLAGLLVVECRRDGAKTGRGLLRLDFQRGLFCGRLLAGLEVLPDAEAMLAVSKTATASFPGGFPVGFIERGVGHV